MIKLAHRGYSAYYPENTMEAFVQAYHKGFNGVETDVHLSKDGELVLIHDEKINRTSNGKGYVKDMTLTELRKYNYCYNFDGQYDIPTLKELLTFIKDIDFKLNIELKTDVIHYRDIEKKVLRLVKEMGVEDKILYSSFYLSSVLTLKELNPKAYVAYLMEYNYEKRKKELLENNVQAFHPRYNYLTLKRIKELKKHQIIIGCWGVLTNKQYQRLKELGVDIIISNEYFK